MKTKLLIFTFVCGSLLSGAINSQNDVAVQIVVGITDSKVKAAIESNAAALLSAMNKAVKDNGKPKIAKDVMEESARKKFEALWKSSPIECTVSDLKSVCRKASSGEYQIRSIPVKIIAADAEHRDEKIALNFNSQGQVSDVVINVKIEGLPEVSVEEAAGAVAPDVTAAESISPPTAADATDASPELETNTPVFSDADLVNLNKILDFVEKLRTAYNCKDMYYLENVYSDNALIINAVKKTVQQGDNTSTMLQSATMPSGWQTKIRSKRQYLDQLALVFKKNKFVNISFDSIKVEPHPGYSKVYGVTLYQKWNSETYSDKGFLFMLIDCINEYEMEIFVRAWAEEKIFSFNNFDLRRVSLKSNSQ